MREVLIRTADTVVFATGMKSNDGLKAELTGKVPELYEVGDCVEPCRIVEVVEGGAKVAYSI